jgi:hypothetical protein
MEFQFSEDEFEFSEEFKAPISPSSLDLQESYCRFRKWPTAKPI